MEEAEATDVKTKWKPTEREYSTKEKRRIIAKVLETAIRTTFKNHIYAFKNRTYQQVSGGVIGLRLTGVVARILMDEWADRLEDLLGRNGIKVRMIKKYVDDVNVVTDCLPRGCYWEEGEDTQIRLT